MLQPHEDISILFGLYLERLIIFQSNCFNIRLKRKEGRQGGGEEGRKGKEGEKGNIQMMWARKSPDVILKLAIVQLKAI